MQLVIRVHSIDELIRLEKGQEVLLYYKDEINENCNLAYGKFSGPLTNFLILTECLGWEFSYQENSPIQDPQYGTQDIIALLDSWGRCVTIEPFNKVQELLQSNGNVQGCMGYNYGNMSFPTPSTGVSGKTVSCIIYKVIELSDAVQHIMNLHPNETQHYKNHPKVLQVQTAAYLGISPDKLPLEEFSTILQSNY